MTYQQAIDYLYSQLPIYQRVGAAALKPNLNNTIAICDALGNPQQKFKAIHIAGTNGKGSVSHMLASVLQSAGYKVGLYTSPHLKDFRERIKINGEMISENEVSTFVDDYTTIFNEIEPSFFELTVGMAFKQFADNKVDVAVIETGLGGRLDSTNILSPIISIITNISLDHEHLLGNTIAKIAQEKAGIIKENTPVVIGESEEVSKSVFMNVASQNKAPIYFSDSTYFVEKTKKLKLIKKGVTYLDNLECELKGKYQEKNILSVIQTCELLPKLGFAIDEDAIRKGLKNIVTNTGLLGRWQLISECPTTIADIGHNVAGIETIVEQLNEIKYKRLLIVFGMVEDKDVGNILGLLPKEALYYFCQAAIPRAMKAKDLQNIAAKHNLRGNYFPSVKEAYKAAQIAAKQNDLVFVGGSAFVVAEVLD